MNIGIDLGFFNNKVTTSFDWFDRKTSDILMQLSMPGTFLGLLSAPYQNVGEVRNRGGNGVLTIKTTAVTLAGMQVSM